MAYNDNQNENPLPIGNDSKRRAVDLIPKFFRTEANRKFLQGTIDQMIQPGVAEKLNGYVGRKTAKAYSTNDSYIGDVSPNRENYQLEPAVVIKDTLDNVNFYKDYNDYLGTLDFFSGNISDHNRLNSQDTYAWNPHIDWDKFTNFREYYWLPNGPIAVPIKGQSRSIRSTYTVTLEDQGDNIAYVFNDGFERNPTLKLYRGQTYRFEIDTPGHPIAFAISRTFTPGTAIITAGVEGIRASGLFDAKLYDETGTSYDIGEFIVLPSSGTVTFENDDNVSTIYPDGIIKLGEDGEEIATVYVEKGIIEFTVPNNAPDRLYYISKNSIDTSGLIRINNIEENSFIDVDQEIVGKKFYTSSNGVELTNGMKIFFQGDVEPAIYKTDQWFVEGVGTAIKLVKRQNLIIPAAYTSDQLIPFDSDKFDTLPFADASSYAEAKDYIIINRASLDRNFWSRYNKWFHRDTIEKSFEYNGLPIEIDESARAKRPIIEFEAGLKLYNFGTEAKTDVDLIDTFTKDVFSTIEGKNGYNVDGTDLAQGMRVLFAADTDVLVRGKIYSVNFITIGNNRQISLIETEDSNPQELETVFITQGRDNAGKIFHYHNNSWILAQEKTKTNQPPMFDLCCPIGNAFENVNIFDSSTFRGTKIFSYKEGSGNVDPELGFPLTYKTIENSGDIVFEFNLLNDSFTYQVGDELITVNTDTANLRIYSSRESFKWSNAWSSTPVKSKQYVIRQYNVDNINQNNFEIDVYENAGELNDLKVIVYVNNKLKKNSFDYQIDRINRRAFVKFTNDLDDGDVVKIKTNSTASKNLNGFYEFPHNLERNPLNADLKDFTFGEVLDHVDTMIEDLNNFEGVYPGRSNLRDLGNINNFGKRFVKHSGSLVLPMYHITNKQYNIIKALRFAKREYAKFKRVFLETAETLGFDGEIRIHVDRILAEINKDKLKTQPFYFSDMLPYGPSNKIEYTVLSPNTRLYAISQPFNLKSLSPKSVDIYLNGKQLVHGRDYNFDTEGFVNVTALIAENDNLVIYEYESTDGSWIAPTPTKLGLYPKYVPELTIDDTYQTEKPKSTGPFKVYGQVSDGYSRENLRGWFYPVYTNKADAERADSATGGTGAATLYLFNGLNTNFYIPNFNSTFGGQDNLEIEAYPIGIPFIKGHDGSYIRAYLDYRDELLLDLETRIFNNIKVEFDNNLIDIDSYIGGEFRNSEFTREEINATLLSEFIQWLKLVDNDYTDNSFYNRLNEFTYNYSSSNTPSGKLNPGFWRAVYKNLFDTDRPHTHPWEMLGFKIKPEWWNQIYGPAPYTKDNLILWKDLEEGRIRNPNGRDVIDDRYARPRLTNFIPVDSQGKLRNPIDAGAISNFVLRLSTRSFSFGDEAPVETAWRRSSEYPFALITSMVLNKPADSFSKMFDVSRTFTNLSGQRVYKDTLKHLTPSDIVYPNTVLDDSRISTAGLVNYIYNLIANDILKIYNDYQNDLRNITVQLGFKLGSYSDKNKINLILDSRSPIQNSEGGVFVPQENYKIIFNTSSPIETAIYSGVAIEKTASGFIVRGYVNDNPFFEYYDPLTGSKSVTVKVGGISETAAEWTASKGYVKGQVVSYQNNFYRVTNDFRSSDSFSLENLVKLAELPVVGGKTAEFKRNFDKRIVKKIPYGYKFENSQEVVNFLLGYDARLQDIGFNFNFVEPGGIVNNWDLAAREFLFWTTQGWASGTVITLSPAANKVFFNRDFFVVDNIYDEFYNYNIFQADGQILPREFGSLLREENSFGLETRNTNEGLYSIVLPLVQKEHVVLLDNRTIFNDVIYEPDTGYRQERIKVTGYRADNWNGGLNIPGFVFDNAETTEWTQWKDYPIGSLVKYKQFYYVATSNAPGSKDFESTFWFRLNDRPEPELITNFDYRINQFTGFYDLDSDGIDSELLRMARHLTGYEKRQYLANIINDDVSQFKFYTGMLQDKGTQNALLKMFEALGSADRENLEFFEEWAIQVSRYGAIDNIQQVEFNFKEDKLLESPQAVELTNSIPVENFDKIYRILPSEVYDKPIGYDHKPFPTKVITAEYIKTGGYVNEDDVTYIAGVTTELNEGDVNLLGFGEYVWITEREQADWNVYQHVKANVNVVELRNDNELNSKGTPLVELTLDKWAKNYVNPGDIVGVRSAQEFFLAGLYTVESVDLEKIKIQVPENNEIEPFANQKFMLTKLRSVRVDDLDQLKDLAMDQLFEKQKVWVDSYDTDWKVLQNSSVYNENFVLSNPSDFDSTKQEFSKEIAVTKDNNNVFVSAPGSSNGKVFYYRRTKENGNLILDQELALDDQFLNEWQPSRRYVIGDRVVVTGIIVKYYIAKEAHTSGSTFDSTKWTQVANPSLYMDSLDSRFGESIDVSPDGEYLVVGIPNASGVKTRFKKDFNPDQLYAKGDIVRYRESLWKANREILPRISVQPFSTFDSYVNIASQEDADSTSINLLVSGDPGLAGNIVDHILVRAPKEMYIGSAVGDTINLYWNSRSYSYPTLDIFTPFDGEIAEIDADFITQEHVIADKIDHVLLVDTFITLPAIGDFVETDTGSAEVAYVSTRVDSVILYLKNTNGVFSVAGELFSQAGDFIGFYTEENTFASSDYLGGFWKISTGFEYSNNGRYFDVGRGLVYADLIPQTSSRAVVNEYYNIQDTLVEIGAYVTRKNQASFITNLSYFGDPNGIEASYEDNTWLVRVGKQFSDALISQVTEGSINNPEYEFRLYDLDNRIINVAASGFSYDILNKSHKIYDLWDGFIDFEYSRFDFAGNIFELQVGDIIVDVQTENGAGGVLAPTPRDPSSAAEVVFYQRNFNNARVYLKILSQTEYENKMLSRGVSPTLTVGNRFDELSRNIGRFEIRRLARSNSDVDRVVAIVNDVDNNIVLGTGLIGKLLVFKADQNFSSQNRTWDTVIPIIDEEYWFFAETIEDGIGRLENPPFALNKDWTQVYNIPADEFGTPGPRNEGAVAIYRRVGNYRLQSIFVSEYGTEEKHFGSKVKIKQVGNYYTLFVGSAPSGSARDFDGNEILDENNEWREHPGKIEIYRHGTKPTDSFKGEYQLTAYDEGDIVIYKDDYYIARKNITSDQNVINDSIYWNKISWRRGKDDRFRGSFDNSYSYAAGSIVDYEGTLYQARTNLAAGELFSTNFWTPINASIDYLGYLPNLTGVRYFNEDVYDPQENIIQFAYEFDVSDNADVLVVTTKVGKSDSTEDTNVIIYKQVDDKYKLTQILKAPNSITDWANNISIKPDASQIAISAPLDDSIKTDQGVVYIYLHNNGFYGKEVASGQYDYNYLITSPNNEETEKFGYAIDYGTDNLIISSLNGDQTIPTTFDVFSQRRSDSAERFNSIYVNNSSSTKSISNTTFDNGFTNFNNIRYDTGVVYVFEDIEGQLIYGEQFRFDKSTTNFGSTVLSNNNHVYVGIPTQPEETSKGIVLDYRKPKNVFAWNILRESITPVDISKIEGAFLYNKRENQVVSYIDYIDPVQGKIAGPVEQEITFKLTSDPAFYNVGSLSDPLVDPNRYWTDKHIGQVWWNINTARFANAYHGSITFQKNQWNRLLPGSSIDIYEWVESDLLPSQWNQLADTDAGTSLGISGSALYGDTKYSAKLIYDDVSKTFNTKYYFWVANKKTIPLTENRNISIFDMTQLIERPREQGYRFISFLGNNRFVINNFDKLITSDDLVLNIKYSTGPKQSQNTHAQYQLFSDGLATSRLNRDIERKWFDSLIGFDTNNRPVPDVNIPLSSRYGVQNRPRQGMFVNRIEALKQLIERTNSVFKKYLIADDFNISNLLSKDEIPSIVLNEYDLTISSSEELAFVSTNKLEPAKFRPIVSNGRIIRVDILETGRGYKVPPSLDLIGSGINADFEVSINNLGQVQSVRIINSGTGYDENTSISVRRFSVLVESDTVLNGKWAIYAWNEIEKVWFRRMIQDFDVSLYWNYVDWYADGYNQFTNINHVIDGAFQLTALNDNIGEIVKINNIGSGGWLLLEKVDNQQVEDYTINYKTIGRQRGTIQLSDSLYDYSKNTVGYDNRSFDSFFFDNNPAKELRIILESLRDNLLVNELAVEYNQLFAASLRYILAEQPRVDWLFKTAFIKAKHNLGELQQDITFQNNNLASFEAYVREVKPYSTKIREFISNYEANDNTNSSITDFDLQPRYDNITKKIETSKEKVVDGIIVGLENITQQYPRKHWLDNVGFEVKEILISDPGSGYTFEPTVTIVGGNGEGATAKAYIGYGKITAIKVTNPGSGYLSAPQVIISGSQTERGTVARATAVIGNSLVRTPTIKIKFDRFTGDYYVKDLFVRETFSGTTFNTIFNLTWPMDLNTKKVKVFVDDVEMLRSTYSFENIPDASGTYSREIGRIIFVNPPALNANIRVEYYKPLSLLAAEDRIQFAYKPLVGMLGNELAQLMTGIDYGGVEIRSFDFSGAAGWDTKGWYTDTWDTFDNTFEDEVFVADGSTLLIELSVPLESGMVYNIYKNGLRIDDPNFDVGTPSNKNAVCNSILGDGTTTVIDLIERNIRLLDGDVLIIRKITSDGSITPDPISYDMALSGGDLAYQTAKGISAEEIIIDGDGFITPTTSSGPEELVPGQVLDTLDIKVYTREGAGQGIIHSQFYIVDGTTSTYDLETTPGSADSVVVKINGSIVDDSRYSINWINNTVTINGLQSGDELNITSISQSSQNILDYGRIVANEPITDYLTTVDWIEDVSVAALINGIHKSVIVYNGLEDFGQAKVAIRFSEPTSVNDVISYTVFKGTNEVNYSQVVKDRIIADGTTTNFVTNLSKAPFYAKPLEHNIIVKVGERVLSAGYNIEYNVTTLNRDYSLELFQQPTGSLSTEDVKVFLNGEEIVAPTQWRFEIATSTIVLADETGQDGDLLEIYVLSESEYTIVGDVLTIKDTVDAGEVIDVYQFSNHDILEIERIQYDVVSRTALQTEDVDFVKLNRLKVGEIKLRKPAVDAQYLWLSLNGKLLTPSVDYYITDDRTKVRLTKTPKRNDSIDVVHFTAQTSVSRFAYRQFKDMLNRTHYKRLDSAATTLAQPLNYFDLRIEVVDGSTLSEPDKGKNLPGIIFIDGERIEYFVIEGNTLRQLRRGTLGTGVKNIYPAGSKVFDQNRSKTIPYQDKTSTLLFEAGGYNEASKFYTNSSSITVDAVEYDFNNNTAFPLGGQLATVRGSGFRPVVELYVGGEDVNISIPVTQIVSDSKIKLSPPAYFQPNSWNQTLAVGKTIVFTGVEFGGIVANKEYTISAIFDSSNFSQLGANEVYINISENGNEVSLTPAAGEMVATYNTTTYVDENTVRFITVENPVGSYDLVVFNPAEPEAIPLAIPQTSYVVPGAIKYVQILLPYSPLPNENTETGWYKQLTEISVRNMVPGRTYKVASLGNTDWSQIGSGGELNQDFLATSRGTGTGTVFDYSSIPFEYWEAKDIDLFASGVRLRKTPLAVYDPEKAPDSPEGDMMLEAEFAVNKNIGPYVRLTTPPAKGTQILIVRKQGKLWTNIGESLAESETSIAKFLRAGTSELPE
jgi:hypothetical protein